MVSSKKILVMLAASLVLASCETTQTVVKPPESAPVTVEAPPLSVPPSTPRVVRSAIVPDDPEPVVKTAAVMQPIVEEEDAASPVATPERVIVPRVTATPAPKPTTAPVSAPVAPAEVIVPPTTVGAGAAAAAASIAPPAALAEEPAAAPPTGITPAESIKTTDAPSAAPPATELPPSSLFNDPAAFLKDPKALLQAKIGGVPLWLVALFVLLAFISLVIGFSGRKAPEPASV